MDKKKTATLSEMISYLQGMLEEVGDVKLYSLDIEADTATVGESIKFLGLSASGALMAEATSKTDKFFAVFKSDEFLSIK